MGAPTNLSKDIKTGGPRLPHASVVRPVIVDQDAVAQIMELLNYHTILLAETHNDIVVIKGILEEPT